MSTLLVKNPQALVSESFLRSALRGKSLLLALPEQAAKRRHPAGVSLFKKSGPVCVRKMKPSQLL